MVDDFYLTLTAKRLCPRAQGCRLRLPWDSGAEMIIQRKAVASFAPLNQTRQNRFAVDTKQGPTQWGKT